MTDVGIVLSICIPSFNRSTLLQELLRELDRSAFLPFRFEVVVVDNASDDRGYDALKDYQTAHYAFVYARQERNVGPYGNMAAALRMARGVFCLYLADDDRLIPLQLASVIDAMQADPAILATFSPILLYDRARDAATHELECTDVVFSRAESSLLVETLGIWGLYNPEIGVFRTDALSRCLFPTPVTYYSYRLMARLLEIGNVAFCAESFYRIVVHQKPDTPPSVRLSSTLGINGWTAMTRGLAIFHKWATGKPLAVLTPGSLPPASLLYLTFAVDEALAAEQFLEVAEIMDYVDSLSEVTVFPPANWQAAHKAAAFDALCRAIRTIPGALPAYLVDLGVWDDRVAAEMDRANPPIRHTSSASIALPVSGEAVFVSANDAQRALLIDQLQLRPGLVFSLESLFRAIGYSE